MLEAFYILVFAQLLLGFYSLWQGYEWLRMARRKMARHSGFFTPRVALICPVKGIESGLEENLAALTEFEYPTYEIFFTLARTTDPVYEVLRRVSSSSKAPAHIVVAGAPAGCAEKVNNLRVAVEQLPDEFEVIVFADSDGRPGKHWLGHLVAPLANAKLGAATAMRWLLPRRGSFWSALAAAWNAPIATLHGEHGARFCWGGGTAIRRTTFEQVRALEYWQGSASDDYSLTRALHSAGRAIEFVPDCLVPSPHETDFQGLLEFSNRQMIITRVYQPGLWALALFSHGLYSATILLGLWITLSAWVTGFTGLHTLLLVLGVALLAIGHGAQRLIAVVEILPAWRAKLLQFGWAWTLLAALVPLLYTWNCIVAFFSRRIVWRGIRYRLVSSTQTQILSATGSQG
jgi:cellulose synthase/poly-beta-1,6-N-acetylglucosamine synthase-like glycosyltransferase